MADDSSAGDEAQRTANVRNQGKKDGLFRACMDSIRSGHSVGQTLRNGMLAAGLLTDVNCWTELLVQFYVATSALETRLAALEDKKNNDDDDDKRLAVRQLLKQLRYDFTRGFEADLMHLLGENWKEKAAALATPPAQEFAALLASTKDEATLIAGVFILWGPMVIGGGAFLRPKIKRAFGEKATHIFADVIGSGRAERRRQFIAAFDELVDVDDPRRPTIVAMCGNFMERNNSMMRAVKCSPWWAKWVYTSMAVAAVAAFVGWRQRRDG